MTVTQYFKDELGYYVIGVGKVHHAIGDGAAPSVMAGPCWFPNHAWFHAPQTLTGRGGGLK